MSAYQPTTSQQWSNKIIFHWSNCVLKLLGLRWLITGMPAHIFPTVSTIYQRWPSYLCYLGSSFFLSNINSFRKDYIIQADKIIIFTIKQLTYYFSIMLFHLLCKRCSKQNYHPMRKMSCASDLKSLTFPVNSIFKFSCTLYTNTEFFFPVRTF